MKHLHRSVSVLALLAPFAAGCGSADVNTPPVTAQVDVNAQVTPPAPPQVDGTAGADVAAPPTDATAGGDAYDDNDPAALNDFHPALDQHGQWVDDPTYGTVWVPAKAEVGQDFTPYSTSGHWAYDGNDYVWVSDYDWGWAPFHYGRWVYADSGWAWIPGREYRGAWVNWGADDSYGYVGWYPMGPTFLWRGGVAVGYTYSAGPRWNYVGRGDVFAVNVGTRVVRGSAAASIAGRVHASGSVGVGGHAAGPAPEKLGFTGNQVPHVSGAGAASLAKAQQFSHPSTATAMGAHPATHVANGANGAKVGAEGHGTVTGTSASTAAAGAHGTPPTTTQASGSTAHAGDKDLKPGHTFSPSAQTTPAQQPVKKKPIPEEQPHGNGKGGGKGTGGGKKK